MFDENNQPFDWDFDNDNIPLIPRDTDGVSEDEVNAIVDDALDTISLEGNDLVYTLMVNGQGKGQINIPKDQFLKNVSYDAENDKLIFVFETESGEVTTEVDITDLVSDLKTEVDEINERLDTFATVDVLNETIEQKNEEIASLNSELYSLKKIVGDLGGNVVYEAPMEGKSLTTLMGNNGTVKLTEDMSVGRYGPGIMASNKTTLNFGKFTLEMNATGDYASILARGTQELTLNGSTNGKLFNNGGGMLVTCNSATAVVNIKGTTTTLYECNRPGAELIYCYAGTINISGGVFKNNGSPYLLNCYDANYNNGTAKIIVTGGKFYDFDPGNNRAEGENTSFLAEGYTTVMSTEVIDDVEHNVYTVKRAS